MKLSFVATALMITASTSFANSIRDEMIYTDHETAYSFSVTSPEEPVETNNHDEFINQCLLSSYNSIHDPSKYFIDSVTQESEQILPPSCAISDHNNLGKLQGRSFQKSCRKSHTLLPVANIHRTEFDIAFVFIAAFIVNSLWWMIAPSIFNLTQSSSLIHLSY